MRKKDSNKAKSTPKTPFQLFETYQTAGPFPTSSASDSSEVKKWLDAHAHNIQASIAFSTFELGRKPTDKEILFTLEDVKKECTAALRALEKLSRAKKSRDGALAEFAKRYDDLNGSVGHLFLLMDPELYRRLPADPPAPRAKQTEIDRLSGKPVEVAHATESVALTKDTSEENGEGFADAAMEEIAASLNPNTRPLLNSAMAKAFEVFDSTCLVEDIFGSEPLPELVHLAKFVYRLILDRPCSANPSCEEQEDRTNIEDALMCGVLAGWMYRQSLQQSQAGDEGAKIDTEPPTSRPASPSGKVISIATGLKERAKAFWPAIASSVGAVAFTVSIPGPILSRVAELAGVLLFTTPMWVMCRANNRRQVEQARIAQ